MSSDAREVTETPAAQSHSPQSHPRRRLLTGVSVVAILTLALFGVGTLLSAGNEARALSGHPEVLRKGCTWDSSGNYVQNCKVWSKSQNRFVTVQIRASNGSDQGIYLLDGMRAREDRSAWTHDVQAAKVYDGSTDTTLVMPVGGASSFYTDWDGGAGDGNKTIKQETFLTSELPDFLKDEFGVSPHNNAIIGLSMSGGPAVTLAERHPEQFKVVQSMSGYYQTDNPIGWAGVFASQTLVSNYTNGIVNMWGMPGSDRWAANDPSKNVNKLKENGQVLIISSGNGFLTPSEMRKLSPQDQISAIALEILSAVSTVLMQMQAAQAGASVISLPNYGGHTWENWARGLRDGKPHVLEALRKNPPVTNNKTQLVSAEGNPNPEGAAKATAAAEKAAEMPALDPTILAAGDTTTADKTADTSASSSSRAPSAGSPSADSAAPGSATPGSSSAPAPSADSGDGSATVPAPDAGAPSAPAAPRASTDPSTPANSGSAPAPAPSTSSAVPAA